MTNKERREPQAPRPLKPGRCDWCGNRPPRGRAYCGPACRVSYNNALAAQGKAVMQLLKHWRAHRGRKGTPGEGVLSEVAHRVDQILREDRERREALAILTKPDQTTPGRSR